MAAFRIQTLYFAHVREKVGASAEVFEVRDGSTVQDVVNQIVSRHPQLEPLLPHLRVALDGEFTTANTPIVKDAELVLIPPVAGGAPTADTSPISPGAPIPRSLITELPLERDHVAAMANHLARSDRGALVTFEGRVRDHARGREVVALEYEAYRPMALAQMTRLLDEVEAEHPGVACLLHHRIGPIPIGENAVVAMAAHAHRAPAFAACARLIERLKADVPIWKHETDREGATWVTERP